MSEGAPVTAPSLDLVWCMFPDQASAAAVAAEVVGAGLAACANILPAARSVYRWQGAVEQADEVPLLCKTGAGQGARLAERIAELHSYDLPAVAWWPAACAPAVAGWAQGA